MCVCVCVCINSTLYISISVYSNRKAKDRIPTQEGGFHDKYGNGTDNNSE